MLKEIIAHFECDRCGTKFTVGMDPATEAGMGTYDSLFDIAVDTISGGVDYREPGRRFMFKTSGSVSKQGHHLCSDCTSLMDQRFRNKTTTEEDKQYL